MENHFFDDADEMRWDVKDHLGSSGNDLQEKKGAFHTQKLSGSVTLESTSPSTTIFKSNYSEIKTEKTFFNHVLMLAIRPNW